MLYNPRLITEEQREKAAAWFKLLDGHFGQTYILLMAPGVELDRSRAKVLNEGGQARMVDENRFLDWLYRSYREQIEAEGATFAN